MKFSITVIFNAIALWVATALLSGVALVGALKPGSVFASLGDAGARVVYFLLAGLVLACVNALIRPVVKFLALPFYVLTLGLFFVVVNALMLKLTAWITTSFDLHLVVANFGWALLGGIVVGAVNWGLRAIFAEVEALN
ncbi:putative membrane protein [Arcanobacterium wilhelmae]|uniref:Membrane protein n=1 Tax=Arcanobacterium wilhelmae TaxID=1803177 RepID=A0ABT9NBH7_9ACTO|nr:phage holin family protein [Arcanobacterium wilhelmae]MDP9801074.1 putative membrane protein [Arcanobacterium wilhelmae]WFN90430.1 phage holin family protein [Arcanobacterium wilhelmae]